MIRWIVVLAAVIGVVIGGFSLIDGDAGGDVAASAVLVGAVSDTSGYARALEPLAWQFPRDFGAHPDYLTEWWYYTGNFEADDGRRFGFQFTIFRRGITPPNAAADTGTEWRTNQLYMAHFAVTDVEGERFYHDSRFSRGGAGLAGALPAPSGEGERYAVWVDDWRVEALDDAAQMTHITATMRDAGGVPVSIDLMLEQVKPPALQGELGLSAKSAEPGNASQYYSLTRLPTVGTITIGAVAHSVSGTVWKDHEFSTSALGTDALGWDWFGLQFENDYELMIGQIRLADGGRDPYFGGALIYPDGSTVYLPSDAFDIETTGTWASPYTGATYPAGWRVQVRIPGGELAGTTLNFTATPQIADQELHGAGIAYWEGTVRIDGDVTGYGYAELTGYAESLTGRF
ncbi:MAG: lipocalin-like domain-containing protein [Chloroflexota bacterium]|nr:lipocalin-like domain-containing protein [Chloroflexota bacterium]